MSHRPDIRKLHKDKDVRALIKALKHKPGRRKVGRSGYNLDDLTVTHFAAMALGDIGGTQAVKPLMQVLKDKNEFKSLREYAASSLGEIGDIRAIDLLKSIHEDKGEDEELRKAAAVALREIGDPEKANPLDKLSISLFRRPNIKKLKDEKKVKKLIKVLGCTQYARRLREDAIKALVEIGDVQAVEPFLNILKDNSEAKKLRVAIANALGELGDVRAVDPLLNILKDNSEDKKLRAVVANALGELGDVRAVEQLTEIVSGWQILRKPYVYRSMFSTPPSDYIDCKLWKHAFDSLEKITGTDLKNEYAEALKLYGRLVTRYDHMRYLSNNWKRYESSYGRVHFAI